MRKTIPLIVLLLLLVPAGSPGADILIEDNCLPEPVDFTMDRVIAKVESPTQGEDARSAVARKWRGSAVGLESGAVYDVVRQDVHIDELNGFDEGNIFELTVASSLTRFRHPGGPAPNRGIWLEKRLFTAVIDGEFVRLFDTWCSGPGEH